MKLYIFLFARFYSQHREKFNDLRVNDFEHGKLRVFKENRKIGLFNLYSSKHTKMYLENASFNFNTFS